MKLKVHLHNPLGEPVSRGVHEGRWVDGLTDPDTVIGEGMWAIPGLVDAHSHLAGDAMPHLASPSSVEAAQERASAALAAGLTLLYDKGWSDETVLDLIEQVDPVDRPHIEAAGRMVANPGGYYDGFATEIDPDEIQDAVQAAIGGRALWVKVIGDWPRRGWGPQVNFNETQLRSAVDIAESSGARVAVHTMAREAPSLAVSAGVHSIEHGLFLTEDDLGPLGDRQGMWVPTIRQVENTAGMLRPGSSGQELLVEGVANASRLLPLALEAGVRVLAGTDLAMSSAQVVEEVLRIAECKVSNRDALAIASRFGHEAAGRSADFEPGAPADAVLYEANPLETLDVLSHPRHVIRQGKVLR